MAVNDYHRAVNLVLFDVWHRRQGHMSHNNMTVVSEFAKFQGNKKDFLCEIFQKPRNIGLSLPITFLL